MPRGRPRVYGPKKPGKKFLAANKAAHDAVQDKEINYLKKAVKIDDHWLNAQLTSSGASTTATMSAFTMPTQGDGYANRDGDNIRWLGMNGKVTFTYADVTNVIRFIIFRWNADTGYETPDISKILQYSTDPHSHYVTQPASRKKFKVLMDKCVAVSQYGTPNIVMPINIKGSAMGSAQFGAAASTGKGVIYYAFLSDSVAVTHPSVAFDCVYRFAG